MSDGAGEPEATSQVRGPESRGGDRRPLTRRRKIQIATIVFVSLAAGATRMALTFDRAKQENSPVGQGYRNVGSVAGTTFWLRGESKGTFGLRTTGALGGLCTYHGSSSPKQLTTVFGGAAQGGAAQGPVQLCAGSNLTGRHIIVDLVPDSAGPMTVYLSDGNVVTQTGTIDPAILDVEMLPSEHLDVLVFNSTASVVNTTFGS